MIRELRIENFKAWADSGKIRMAPLTVFCGNNSSGKSSIAQFLLMLKQTVESYDRLRVLHTGDSDSLVDLGTYGDIIHGHDESKHLNFGFKFDTQSVKISNAVTNQTEGSFSKIAFDAEIGFDKQSGKSVLHQLNYNLINGRELNFQLISRDKKYALQSDSYQFTRQKGRGWNLPHPENFFGFPDEAIAYYQNTGFLQDLSLAMKNLFKSMYYLGPLREHPERFYQFSGDTPPHVGEKGKYAVNAMLAAQERRIVRAYKQRGESFDEVVARWLKDMGLIHSFRIVPIKSGRKEYEVRIRVGAKASEVLITDVGFGISQLLPVIVQCFYVPSNSTLFFEQPEIHLHPSVQGHLGDLFIEAIRARESGKDRNVQVIVESHSEHLIRRIQRRIADETLQPTEVAVYFIHQHEGKARMRELEFDMFGEVSNWPENFFGDDLEDLREMSLLRHRRKMAMKNG